MTTEDMALPDNDRRFRTEVLDPAGQATFTFDFPIDDAADIVVYVDDVEASIASVDVAASEVTIEVAAAQGAIVAIEGLTSLTRKQLYPIRGGLPSSRLNMETNKVFHALQEMRRDIDRMMMIAKSSADVSAVLPTLVADRALMVNGTATGFAMGPTSSEIAGAAAAAAEAIAARDASYEHVIAAAAGAALAERWAVLDDDYVSAGKNSAKAWAVGGVGSGRETDNAKYYAEQAAISQPGLVMVSPNDTVRGYLQGKLVAGANIALTETDDGGNEKLAVAVTGLGDLASKNDLTVNRKIITGSSNYSMTAGLVFAEVEAQGGGAGGGWGGGAGGCGAGGGGGGYSKSILTAAQITAALSGGVIPVTIGAAGVGAAAAGTAGTAGASTSFGSLVIAPGGNPGAGTTAAGGSTMAAGATPAAAGTGQIALPSRGTQAGMYVSGGGYGNSNGADSFFGVGGNGAIAANTNGANATGYGAGGGGSQGNTATKGGNGTPGICIVTEYILN